MLRCSCDLAYLLLARLREICSGRHYEMLLYDGTCVILASVIAEIQPNKTVTGAVTMTAGDTRTMDCSVDSKPSAELQWQWVHDELEVSRPPLCTLNRDNPEFESFAVVSCRTLGKFVHSTLLQLIRVYG